ncbi:MAG: hypothetical protein JST06_09035 [Bacteroidetes bacterium]|nr:hypothetical protein [Bacteroidota bacterium]MBS1629327.1 hypothetical protein [Bacteroidota bacterium]
MNKLLTIGILAGGGLLAYRAFQLNALAGNITTRMTGVRVHQLNLSGLTIAVGVAINNPTKSTVAISKPVVILTSNGQYIGESDAEGQVFNVAAQKVSSIGEILIKIPLTSAMTIFKGINLSGLFAAFGGQSLQTVAQTALSQIKVPIEAQISFYADSLFVKLPPVRVV